VNWAESMERGADPGGGRSLVRVQWERRGIYGLNYDLEAARVGAAFDPTLGFVARRDYDRARLTVSHGWRAPRESRLLGLFGHVHGAAYRRMGGGLESATFGPAWTGESKTGHAVTVQLRQRREVLDRDFAFGPEAHVPPGTHDFGEVVLAYSPARTALQIPLATTLGTFYDGRRVSLSASRPSASSSTAARTTSSASISGYDTTPGTATTCTSCTTMPSPRPGPMARHPGRPAAPSSSSTPVPSRC